MTEQGAFVMSSCTNLIVQAPSVVYVENEIHCPHGTFKVPVRHDLSELPPCLHALYIQMVWTHGPFEVRVPREACPPACQGKGA